MKKIILCAAMAVFGFANTNAQDADGGSNTTQGTWFFGADAGITFVSTKATPEFDGNETGEETKTSVISFTPSANYFVMDNLAIGLDLLFQSSKEEYSEPGYSDDYTTTTFAIIPNATYFFADGNFRPFLGAGVGYMSAGGEEDVDKYGGLVIKGQGGVAYFINNSVALNFGVEYLNSSLSNKEESDYKIKSNTFGVGVGFSFFLN